MRGKIKRPAPCVRALDTRGTGTNRSVAVGGVPRSKEFRVRAVCEGVRSVPENQYLRDEKRLKEGTSSMST